VKYEVHLTFEGDAALAAQWAGWAKKKARQFGMSCRESGQLYLTHRWNPTADVEVKVRYANGIQYAHVSAKPARFGFVFRLVTPGTGTWWDTSSHFDHNDVIIGFNFKTPDGFRARNFPRPVNAPVFTYRYGAWPCQETASHDLITLAARQMLTGRAFPTYPTPYRFYADRMNGFGDPGPARSGRNCYFKNGARINTANPCFGAFSFARAHFVVFLVGGFDLPSFIEFSPTATFKVYRVNGDPSDVANLEELASVSVADMTLQQHATGFFRMSPDGAVGAAYINGTLIYLRMAYDEIEDDFTATFDKVPYPHQGGIGWAPEYEIVTGGDLQLAADTGHYFHMYDVVSYDGAWVPAVVGTELMEIHGNMGSGGSGVTAYRRDLVIWADVGFTGDFTTEIYRAELVSGTDWWHVAAINLQRGMLAIGIAPVEHPASPFPMVLHKIDFDTASVQTFPLSNHPAVANLSTPQMSQINIGMRPPVFNHELLVIVQTRADAIFLQLGKTGMTRTLHYPIYDGDGEIASYTKVNLTDVPGLADALGEGAVAADALGPYGLFGTI
jgi:hypothetical protein